VSELVVETRIPTGVIEVVIVSRRVV